MPTKNIFATKEIKYRMRKSNFTEEEFGKNSLTGQGHEITAIYKFTKC